MRKQATYDTTRVDWVDYAKGWCIVLVVMMHSTLGVGEAFGHESWLHDFVAWARPFRMPDFFLVAGLFLPRTINSSWRIFFDRKVLHFAYFYLLWTLIQGVPKLLILKSGDLSGVASGLAFALVQPFGTMWFIYLLPVFFVVTKLLRHAPVGVALLAAAILQMAQIHTGSIVIDEFTGRYVYFFAGYAFSTELFELARWVRNHRLAALAALFIWGGVNALAVRNGVAALPGVSLILGFGGAAAVIGFSALLAQARVLPFLRELGSRSIVIFLAFFLPMAVTRSFLAKFRFIDDIAIVSLIVTMASIAFPIVLNWMVKDTSWRFLFERPAGLRIRSCERRADRANESTLAHGI